MHCLDSTNLVDLNSDLFDSLARVVPDLGTLEMLSWDLKQKETHTN